jgi:ABC-type transport system involved in cytochrome c biogenesis permease subunit
MTDQTSAAPAGTADTAKPVAMSTSSRGTKALGLLTLVSAVFTILYSFWFSKADVELGNTVRILYVHVPTVSIAYLCMLVNAGRVPSTSGSARPSPTCSPRPPARSVCSSSASRSWPG